jgi:hypothetical protein
MATSLTCRVQLSQFAAALRVAIRMVPSYSGYQRSAYLLELKSDSALLTLRTSNGSEEAIITLPCVGDDFCLLVSAQDVHKHVFKIKAPKGEEFPITYEAGKRKKSKLVLPPLPEGKEGENWFEVSDPEKFEVTSLGTIPRRQRVEITPTGEYLSEILDYLWKGRNDKEDKPVINSLLISADKLAMTDGHHMHVQGVTQPNPFSAILPKASTEALYTALKSLKPGVVRIQYAETKNGGVFVCHLGDNVKVKINAQAGVLPDQFHTICPPLQEAICTVVEREPLEQLLKDLIKRKIDRIDFFFGRDIRDEADWRVVKIPSLSYRYRDNKAQPSAPGIEPIDPQGRLPSWRADPIPLNKERGFNPKFLLQAIDTLGGPLQLIQPWMRHPDGELAGQDDEGSYPLVINGPSEVKPLRYAIVMPMRD